MSASTPNVPSVAMSDERIVEIYNATCDKMGSPDYIRFARAILTEALPAPGAPAIPDAIRRLIGTPDDPNIGWRGDGTTEVYACEFCNSKNSDCTKIEHTKNCPVPAAYAALADPSPPSGERVAPEGEVVVTKDHHGVIVAVTRQDEDGRILSIIAEASAAQRIDAEKLHREIMNLPPTFPPDFENEHEQFCYKIGHRDARHAAAELVIGASNDQQEK